MCSGPRAASGLQARKLVKFIFLHGGDREGVRGLVLAGDSRPWRAFAQARQQCSQRRRYGYMSSSSGMLSHKSKISLKVVLYWTSASIISSPRRPPRRPPCIFCLHYTVLRCRRGEFPRRSARVRGPSGRAGRSSYNISLGTARIAARRGPVGRRRRRMW